MAERLRSKDGSRDTDRILDHSSKAPIAQGGSTGGTLARSIGADDEIKRIDERPAGQTRVQKSDEARSASPNPGRDSR